MADKKYQVYVSGHMASQDSASKAKIRRKAPEKSDKPVTVIPAKSDDELRKAAGIPKKAGSKIRVAAYCRVSTPSENQVQSIENQKEHFDELFEMHKDDWEPVGIYADEGISGTYRKRRKAFNAMIDACHRGEIDMIIIKDVARYTRNIVDGLEVARELRNLVPPVGIFFETLDLNTLRPDYETLLAIMTTCCQLESTQKSESMKWSYKHRYENGRLPCPTYYLLGYDSDEDGNMIINEEEAKTVRVVFFAYCPNYLYEHGIFQFGRKLLVGMIAEKMGWSNKFSYRVIAEMTEDNMALFEFERAVPSTTTRNREDLLEKDQEDEDTTYYWQDTKENVLKDEGDATETKDSTVDIKEHIEIPDPIDEEEDLTENAEEDKPMLDDIDEAAVISHDNDVDDNKDVVFDHKDIIQWASMQFKDWGWSRERIVAWSEEMAVNTKAATQTYISWKTGVLTEEEFYLHHKELEQMEFAFEFGRRVSIIRRIRANLKAFNPTMMAIIYDERAETCEQILNLLRRFPHMSDFDIALRIN